MGIRIKQLDGKYCAASNTCPGDLDILSLHNGLICSRMHRLRGFGGFAVVYSRYCIFQDS
jgi:hypothetical protein